jgi:hypothetical protein
LARFEFVIRHRDPPHSRATGSVPVLSRLINQSASMLLPATSHPEIDKAEFEEKRRLILE